MMKRVVTIGPESTGKSTLCQQLATHYNTVWCPEFARDYLLKHGMSYSYDELTIVAKGQIELQKKLEAGAQNDIYFIDTDMYVMKVWHEVAFGKCPPWILKIIARTKYDLYLLCNTDLPWTKDQLREYPEIAFRKKLFKMYKDIMVNSGTAWTEISGTDEQRLRIAIKAVNGINNRK